MKFKYTSKKIIRNNAKLIEEKITTYLLNNHYRITERGANYIIFTEDEFSKRKIAQSDFYTRIGGGKFLFNKINNEELSVELIYITSITYYIFLVMLVSAFGIYTNNIGMPIVFSIVLFLPILFRVNYINGNVFNAIIE